MAEGNVYPPVSEEAEMSGDRDRCSSAMKFRKKPVEIEAMQFSGLDSYMAMCEWARPYLENPEGNTFSLEELFRFEGGSKPLMLIRTLEGTMAANIGDWVIRGVKDEFYPCKPDIFEATYEPA